MMICGTKMGILIIYHVTIFAMMARHVFVSLFVDVIEMNFEKWAEISII